MSSTNPSKDDFEAERESIGSSGLARLHAEINRVADEFFYRLGHWVATYPKRTLAIGMICVALCCTGFLNFSVESSADDLWVPAESLSRTQEKAVLSYFDEGFKYAVILLEHPDADGNVLTKESLDIFWELNAETLQVETEEGHRFADLCLVDFYGDSCAEPLRGVARFWGSSFEKYNATVNNDADVLLAVNVARFPDGGAVSLAAIFGNSLTYDDDLAVTGARVMTQSYEVAASLSVDDEYGEVYEWEGLFQDRMRQKAAEVDTLNVAYFTGRSMDDSLAESVSGEVFLFVVTYAIMVMFVMMGLGRCRSGAVERRSWLGFGGVCIVVASGLAAYGINSGFGVPFTSLSQILPFILVGIGVDDMFVMLASFDHTNPTLPVEERMAVALRRSGVSITYSSLTNFSAFMLGSFTVLPAVEYFCLYAGTAILFDFILQVTAFPALLVMDTNRQMAGRLDWCCCFSSAKYLKERAETGASLPIADEECPPVNANKAGSDRHHHQQQQQHHHQHHQDAESGRAAHAAAPVQARSTAFKRKGGEEGSDVHHLTGLGRWMKDVYAPFLLSVKGKALVLLSFAGLLAAGIYGVAEVSQGFNVLDVAPDEHFARTYKELAIEYALDQDSQFVPLTIYTPAVDYTDVHVQSVIQGTDALMVNQEHFSGPVNSWLTSFTKWAENSTEYRGNISSVYGFKVYDDKDTFYSALEAFTSDGDSATYLSDLSFDENGQIEMSRSGMYLVDLTSTASSVEAITSARKVISLSPLEPAAFAYSPLFVYFEQYLVIYKELITNFVLALAAVAVLSLLVLGAFRIVVLVCFTVVMIDIELLGFVHHWGLQVNGITVIELIMAVGLVVDYMVHIVHYYLLQDPEVEKDLRIGRALGEIGPSVTIGAATTFLGIMPMAFASNAIFRVFFKMFIVIIIFGYVHGVIFIPVALSLLPDSSAGRFFASGAGGREAAGAEVKEEEPDPMGLHFAVPSSGTKLHVCAICSATQAPGGKLPDNITAEHGGHSSGGGCRGTGRGHGSSLTSGGERRRHTGGGGGSVATVAPGFVAGEGVGDGGHRLGKRTDSEGVAGGGDGGSGAPENGRSSFGREGDGDGDGYSSLTHTTLSSLGTGVNNFGACAATSSREIDHGGDTHGAYEASGSEAAAGHERGEQGEVGGDRKFNDHTDVVHYSLANDNRRLGPRSRAEPRRETGPPTSTNLGSRSESNNSLGRFDSRSSSVSTLNSLAWSSSMLSRNSSLVSATNSLFATGPIYPAGAATASAAGPIPLEIPPPPRSPALMRHDTVEVTVMDPAIHRWSLQQPPRRVYPAQESPAPSQYSEQMATARATPMPMPTERREGFKMWPSKKTRQTVVPWTWQVD